MLGSMARLGHSWKNAAVQRNSFEVVAHGRQAHSLRHHCANLRKTVRDSRVNILRLASRLHGQSGEAARTVRRLHVTTQSAHGSALEIISRPSKRRRVIEANDIDEGIDVNPARQHKRARTEPGGTAGEDESLIANLKSAELFNRFKESIFGPPDPKPPPLAYPFDPPSDSEHDLLFTMKGYNPSAQPAENPRGWFYNAGRKYRKDKNGWLNVNLGAEDEPLVESWKAYRRREKYIGDRAVHISDPLERQRLALRHDKLMQEWAKRFVLEDRDITEANAVFPTWVHMLHMRQTGHTHNKEDIFFSRSNHAELISWDRETSTWKHEFLPPRPIPDPRGDWKTYHWVPLTSYGPWPRSY